MAKEKSARQQIMDDLRAVSLKPALPDHHANYKKQIFSDTNDRGAALLVALSVETALENALMRIMKGSRGKEMFSGDQNLSTFNSKIWLGYALNLYGDSTNSLLRLIKHIRNAFAHAQIPIDFNTPEIVAGCTLLPPLDGRDYDETQQEISKDFAPARKHFQIVCAELAWNLMMRNLAGPIHIHRDAFTEDGKLNPGINFDVTYTEIVALQAPLD